MSERFWYSFCCKTRCCSDYKNGDVYEGYWAEDEMNGFGIATYAD